MLKSTDLCIGNFVKKHIGTGEYAIIEVCGIHPNYINQDDIPCYGGSPIYYLEGENCIEGIPLTEEWFVRLGLENTYDMSIYNGLNQKYYHFKISIYNVRLSPDGACYFWYTHATDYNEDIEMFPDSKIRFVHELQNLISILIK